MLTITADGSKRLACFFIDYVDRDSDRLLSEDYNFCRLVRHLGMKVWMAPWIKINHIGFHTFRGDQVNAS